MTLLSFILLGIAISIAIIGIVLGHHEIILKKVRNAYARINAKATVSKLDRLGFFDLTPKAQLENSKSAFERLLVNRQSVWSLYASEEDLNFDYRSFVIEYDTDKEVVNIDSEKFTATMQALGLKITFGKVKYISDTSIELEVLINQNYYRVPGSIDDETDNIAINFAKILNIELLNSQPTQKAYQISEYRLRFVILTNKLRKYILGY